MKFDPKKDVRRLLIITAMAFVMAVNLKTFIRAGELFPGGASGMTLLIQRLVRRYANREIPYTVVNILLNAFPVYLGFRYIGKKFTLFSLVMIALTGVFADLLPDISVTDDMLLISVFGGIVQGFGVSMTLEAGATTGGTDFIGIYLSEKKAMDSFPIVLGINAVILCLAGVFFGWDKALYSIIFEFVMTQVLHAIYRRYQQATVLVVTSKAQEICDEIYRLANHGATIVNCEGAHEHQQRKMVYSVVSRAESGTVIQAVREIDPEAFVNLIDTKKVAGRFYFRPED